MKWKKHWAWFILTVPRRCVICGGLIPGGTKAVQTNFRGKITLCRWCREALDKENRLDYAQWPEEPELFEGYDMDESINKHRRRTP